MRKILLEGEIPVNCYFIEHNKKCFIVDPGYEKAKVIKYVKDQGLSVLGILLTHAHIDHIGAIDAFDVPVYLHELEVEILVDNYKNGFDYFGKVKPYSIDAIRIVEMQDGHCLYIDDLKIEVMHTPGHTIGGVCYKVENELYTGDTLFEGTVGKWTFPTGDLNTLKSTIIKLIETQDQNLIIHPAHGNSSTIKAEQSNNYFYNLWKQ